jgi:mannose-6-phosphate isomerase-like protein (cupin superfamily)
MVERRRREAQEASMDYTVVNVEELPHSEGSHDFEGYLYGGAGVSVILVDMAPGEGPKLHQHAYEEVFIVLEGRATYTIGATTLEATAGQIAIVPAGVPHKFINSGAGRLRQVDIHHSPRFITQWLED